MQIFQSTGECINQSYSVCGKKSVLKLERVFCRCMVPECESIKSNDFNPRWLEYAIPNKNGYLDPCARYEFIGTADAACSAENFNQSNVIGCEEFIIKNNEQRLVSHVSFSA